MTFGVMFHHFHRSGDEQSAPGSITGDMFDELLGRLSEDYTILAAEDYSQRAQRSELSDRDICITFDDALRPQFDIAKDVLDARGIKAFFFVYTGAFREDAPIMEFARDYRSSFPSTDNYYEAFWSHMETLGQSLDDIIANQFPDNYLSAFPFYTRRDREYRYVRDHVLKENYEKIVRGLMDASGYDWAGRQARIFMPESNLRELADEGHIIGLHSVTHPTMMQELPETQQRHEYVENMHHLSALSPGKITTMSHPCGNYGAETLSILRDMDIRVGFRSSMTPNHIESLLEIPRDDHSNLITKYGIQYT